MNQGEERRKLYKQGLPLTRGLKQRDWVLALVMVIISVNAIVYSLVDFLRYQSYNASVYDLGLASQALYGVTHGQLNLKDLIANKLIYIPMGLAYYLSPNPVNLQYFQAFFISLGALPIYLISREKIQGKMIPLSFALLWILYYPMGGVYWFDFHFMSLFPTLFLFGIYFSMKHNTKAALSFLFLASITDFLAPIILAFFAVYVAYSDMKYHNIDPYRNRIAIPLLAFVLAIFVFVIYYYGFSYFSQYISQEILTYNPGGVAIPVTYAYKAGYFLYLMVPLLFLSLFGFEFLITLIPYAALAVVNNYYPYVNTILYQYPALTAATLFVAAILGVSRLANGKKITLRRATIRNVLLGAVILNVFLAAFLTPVGNIYTQGELSTQVTHYFAGMSGNYNASSNIAPYGNVTPLNSVGKYIPIGSSVLIQNNMPQFTDDYNWSLPFNYNFSLPDHFAILDTYSPYFDHFYLGNNSSRNMMHLANGFLRNDTYHVLYQNGGIILLSMSHTSPVFYKGLDLKWNQIPYDEINRSVYSTVLTPGNFSFSLSGPSLTLNGTTNATLIYRTDPYGRDLSMNLHLRNMNGTLTGYLNCSMFFEIYGIHMNYIQTPVSTINLRINETGEM